MSDEYEHEVDYLADWPREDYSTWQNWVHGHGWQYPLPKGDAVSSRPPMTRAEQRRLRWALLGRLFPMPRMRRR